MSNPFKVGDVVYHPRFPNGHTITTLDSATRSMCPVFLNGQRWFNQNELSFTPWPKANHERPLADGLYIVQRASTAFPYLYRRAEGYWWEINFELKAVNCVAEPYRIIQRVIEDMNTTSS